jgi:hypothetical protein
VARLGLGRYCGPRTMSIVLIAVVAAFFAAMAGMLLLALHLD